MSRHGHGRQHGIHDETACTLPRNEFADAEAITAGTATSDPPTSIFYTFARSLNHRIS